MLEKALKEEEMDTGIQSCAADKTPGLDYHYFTMVFFQKNM